MTLAEYIHTASNGVISLCCFLLPAFLSWVILKRPHPKPLTRMLFVVVCFLVLIGIRRAITVYTAYADPNGIVWVTDFVTALVAMLMLWSIWGALAALRSYKSPADYEQLIVKLQRESEENIRLHEGLKALYENLQKRNANLRKEADAMREKLIQLQEKIEHREWHLLTLDEVRGLRDHLHTLRGT